MKKYILAVCICSTVFHAITQETLIEKVVKELGISYENEYPLLTVEKVLPGSPGESVVVIPMAAEGDGFLDIFAYILLVEGNTGKIKSRYTEKWTSDAISLSWVEIDTAPYFLKENTRAFGIRLNYTGHSGPFPYERELLTLFASEGMQLVPVLHQLEVSKLSGEIGMDCQSETETEKSILLIAAEQTNGYFNLTIKNKIVHSTTTPKPNNDDCNEKLISRTEKRVLKFIAGKYQ